MASLYDAADAQNNDGREDREHDADTSTVIDAAADALSAHRRNMLPFLTRIKLKQ